MTLVLILAPLRIEARALRRGAGRATVVRTGMGPKAASLAGRRIGTLAGEDTQAVATSAGGETGAVAAWTDSETPPAAARAGGQTPPVAVVVAGFCGGLLPEIRTGDVIVASELRGPAGVVALPSAPVVADILRSAGLTVHVGPIVGSERVALGSRRARAATDGCLGVDMESCWLLEGCAGTERTQGSGAPARREPRHAATETRETGVPTALMSVAVVRAVSDTAGRRLLGGMLPTGWLKAYRSLVRAGSALEVWAATLQPIGAPAAPLH